MQSTQRKNSRTPHETEVQDRFDRSAVALRVASQEHADSILSMINADAIATELYVQTNKVIQRGIARCVRDAMYPRSKRGEA